MPLEIDRLRGYVPTAEQILKALEIDSPSEMRGVVLERCRDLYKKAHEKKKIQNFGTPFEFIICKSDEFFPILTKMGYGSCSMVIKDDFGPEAFFLIFEDLIPKEFFPIAAAHESTEYRLTFLKGLDQSIAHSKASQAEVAKAEQLHLNARYYSFLKSSYPEKYKEIKNQSR